MKPDPTDWGVDIRIGCCAIYPGPLINCLSDNKDKLVAYQEGQGDFHGGTYRLLTEQQVTNFRLMGAAPKLLAALLAAQEALRTVLESTKEDIALKDQIEAAIQATKKPSW